LSFTILKNYYHNQEFKYFLWVVIACSFLILFWGLGSLQLMSLNEGRRALVIKEMYQTGDWLLPRLNGELYLTKPPLFYWFAMLFSSIHGAVNEWTLRLPSAVSALITCGVAYKFAQRRFGQLAAICTLVLLIANLGFAMLARRAEIEMLLTALCFGSLISAIKYTEQQRRVWLYLSYGLLGLAVLTKGPVAMLFVTLPILLVVFWRKDSIIRSIVVDWRAWGFFFIVALSWYALVTIRLGPDIWSLIVKRDMLEKMQGDTNVKPVLSYLGWITVDFLMLTGLFLIKPANTFRINFKQANFLLLIAAVLIPLLVFSLFSNKHAKYLLPIYPVIAILLGVHVRNLYQAASAGFRRAIYLVGILLPFALAIFYVSLESQIFSYRVAVFPEFQQWSKKVELENIYAYDTVDSRLVYYASKPIKPLDKSGLSTLSMRQATFVLLAEDSDIAVIPSSACKLKEFSPYLKKKKKLIAFGFGAICHADFK